MERLTAEDRMMLWADEVWPQHMGAVAKLETGRDFRIEAAREAVMARLHRVPRLRQVLYVPRAELGGPLWVDDRSFDIRAHVREQALEAPGDDAALFATAADLWQRPLDRSRPLWEMWFLNGLADGRVGLFVRMHHAVGDGIAGMATLASLLDTDAVVAIEPAPAWSPSDAPTEAELTEDERRSRRVARAARWSRVAHPVRTARALASSWSAIRELVAEPSLPATSLTRLVGEGRRVEAVRARTESVISISHAHGAKVNDVLLTAVAGGLRRLLAARGEHVGGVIRVYVPVSLRHGRYAGARGNDIAQMVVPLPVGVGDPVERLRLIAAETAMRKARARPSLGVMPSRGRMGRMFLKLIDRQRVNVTTADLPGPPVPLFIAGARVVELFPMLPLIGKVSLGVGALSYAGQFAIMAAADREAYPDLQTFAAGMRDDLAALESTVRAAAVA